MQRRAVLQYLRELSCVETDLPAAVSYSAIVGVRTILRAAKVDMEMAREHGAAQEPTNPLQHQKDDDDVEPQAHLDD